MRAALLLCAAGLAGAPSGAAPVVFRHPGGPGVERVSVAGSFNNWNASSAPMQKDDSGWKATLDLEPGTYLYKLVLNGNRWIPDPSNTVKVGTDENSGLVVGPGGRVPPGARGDGRVLSDAVRHTRSDVIRLNARSTRFRVETAANDVGAVTMRFVSPRPKDVPMKRVGGDSLREVWQATFADIGPASYAFVARDGDATARVPGAGDPPYAYNPAASRLFQAPAWVRDTVWYQVFPERFCDGDPANNPAPPRGVPGWETALQTYPRPNDHFWGGDLEGVISKLPYLKALGVSGIYLNPVFEGPDTHLYATTDYLKVAPNLGTNDTLKRLVQAAHRQGMRVMLDGVFNHTAIGYPAFQDILRKQEASAFRDWYFVRSFPVLDPATHYNAQDGLPAPYDCWAGHKWMPKLNVLNPPTQEHLLTVARHWIEAAGIDGWRLDVANEVPHEFWRRFRPAVKGAKPDAVIVGEVWETAAPWLQGDQFDSTMNYPFRGIVLDYVARGRKDAAGFAEALTGLWETYPPQASASMFNLLGSHDTTRLLNELGGDARKAVLAYAFLMTWPGSPCVYYGDEIGLTGGGDPWNRAPMAWSRTAWNPAIGSAVRKAIALRNRHPALRGETFSALHAPRGGRSVAFLRRGGGQTALTAFNASDSATAFTLEVRSLGAAAWRDEWNAATVTTKNGFLALKLPPWGVAVLFPAPARAAGRA